MTGTVDYKAGQTVFVVLRHSEPRDMAIASVGRKWVTLDERYRFARGSRLLDGKGYASPGAVYESKAEYAAELQRERLWSRLRELTQRPPPAHIDGEAMDQALKLLGVRL